MPRPEYPSDERRRKNKPAVRVHLSVLNHPRYGAVFDHPEQRGIVVGIWLIAGRAHASKTGDLVSLSRADVRWITGRAQDAPAERAIRACCERMEYAVIARGARLEIQLRNFSRKQGFTPQGAEQDSATPAPSESESESESKSESESSLLGAFDRVWTHYPKRAGGNPRGPAFEAWRARLREGVSAEALESAVERYAAFCNATGKIGTETVQQAASFFGPKKRGYAETWEIPRGTPNGKSESHPARPSTDDEWAAEERRARDG